MRTNSKSITSLFVLLPLVFGFTLVSSLSNKEENSTKHVVQDPAKGTVYLYRPSRAVGAIIKTQIKV